MDVSLCVVRAVQCDELFLKGREMIRLTGRRDTAICSNSCNYGPENSNRCCKVVNVNIYYGRHGCCVFAIHCYMYSEWPSTASITIIALYGSMQLRESV